MSDSLHSVSIHIQKDSPEPLYTQITQAIAQAIEDGQVPPDSKLPSIRSLAKRLGVNNVTVVTAYKHLEQQGFAYSKTGSGTFVRPAPITNTARQIFVPHDGINFASATPTPDIFPVQDFKRLLNTVLDRDGGHAFGYQESQGWPALRGSLAQYLNKNDIQATMESIHIISGAQQGIDLTAKILINQGDTIFVESPTYHGAIASFQSRGARIVAIPLDIDGPNLTFLQQQLKKHKPKLFYAMPNYQNPTGYSWSRQKKQALLTLAKKHQFSIVEDDYLSELSFTGKKYTTLKAMDKDDLVVYIKSFSKILMPGLRLGLMVVPETLNHQVGAAKQHSDISSSGLLQRTLELYMKEETWQKHLEYMKETYAKRYHTLIQAVDIHLENKVDYTPPGGGLHLWLRLMGNATGDQLFNRCQDNNVLITPGSFFAPSENFNHWFRLSFAAVHQEDIPRGVEVIAKSLLELEQPKSLQPIL